MVDPDRLRRVLRRIAADVEELQAYADQPASGLLASRERLGNIKYLLVTAIEGCVDAAQHVCASERWGPPKGQRRAVGLRNVLVHEYRDVDDRRVVEAIGQLAELDRYIVALSALVA